MKYKYIKEHNNYDLTLNKEYKGSKYKEGWILIESDDKENQALYREECFQEEQIICGLCKKIVKPLDAHMTRIKGKLTAVHIDCFNKKSSVEIRLYNHKNGKAYYKDLTMQELDKILKILPDEYWE